MLRREAIREYAGGALWLLPCVAGLAALVAGSALSQVEIGPGSALAPLTFQGTADDARALLIAVAGTVVTVIALVLGLTVVALQISSAQFSPRLLRNFLRDRPNQLVLSVFVATFAYTAAGLYTVGVSAGSRTEEYPRLAVSGALVLLFASLGMVVLFADHMAHSIQIDAITRGVERRTLAVVRTKRDSVQDVAPSPPSWAVPLVAGSSGYIQTAHPERILPVAARYDVHVCLRLRVGEHVVAGTTLAWAWASSPEEPVPDPKLFDKAVDAAVRIGFERTFEQDAAFGIRQLVDVACKALSPAINDPYSAIQAIDHLSVIFCALAERPLGADVVRGPGGHGLVAVPGRRFGEYLSVMCGLIRRNGAREPTVLVALLRLLARCGEVLGAEVVHDHAERRAALVEQADLIVADAERQVVQPSDLVEVRAAADAVKEAVQSARG